MKLSCIVVSYEVRDLLETCVASLADSDEILVVDNGTDGSAQMVRERFPEVRVFEAPENPGFGASINLAARHASGDALLLLNPDAALAPGQLELIRGALTDDVAAVGFRQVDEHGRFQLAFGGEATIAAEVVRFAAQMAIDHRWHWAGEWVDVSVDQPRDVAWVAASSMLVRRDAFEDVSGFDDRFFLYFEDIDLCLRLRERGHRVLYDPTVTVLHHRGRSADRAREPSARAYRISQRRFWRKHRGPLFESLVELYQRARGVAPT